MPLGFTTRLFAGLKREPVVWPWERLVWSSAALAAAVFLACMGWESTAPIPDDDAAYALVFSNLPFQL